MNKREWYRDRIMWKVEQSHLLDQRCAEYSSLGADQRRVVDSALPDDADPVLVFWADPDKWTVLGSNSIFSLHDGALSCCELDDIGKEMSLCHEMHESQRDKKANATLISLEKPGVTVWAPAGQELFGLMNILLMFPLGVPVSSNSVGGQ